MFYFEETFRNTTSNTGSACYRLGSQECLGARATKNCQPTEIKQQRLDAVEMKCGQPNANALKATVCLQPIILTLKKKYIYSKFNKCNRLSDASIVSKNYAEQ